MPEFKTEPKLPAQSTIGGYQDIFTIGEAKLSFTPTTIRQAEPVAAQVRGKFEQQRLGDRITLLLEAYHYIKDIPPELLLSITPEQVSQATQQERDEYYQVQIEKFGSEDQIPADIINSRNSHILVQQFNKLQDSGQKLYLCLAKIGKDSNNWGLWGTKYFYE